MGATALSYSARVRVRATVKLSAAFFHDESSIAKGGAMKMQYHQRMILIGIASNLFSYQLTVLNPLVPQFTLL